jgi:hypothetical protein
MQLLRHRPGEDLNGRLPPPVAHALQYEVLEEVRDPAQSGIIAPNGFALTLSD